MSDETAIGTRFRDGLWDDNPGLVQPQQGRPIVGITALILIMGLIACGKPMGRALRIQPTEALREGG